MTEEIENGGGDDLRFVDHLGRTSKPLLLTEGVVDGVSVTLAAIYKGLDHGFQVIDLKPEVDKWRDRPRAITGTARALTLDSFIELVNRHKDDGSAVFADISTSSPALTAVIDYHELDHDPRFGRHRIGYAFPLSDEWKAWGGINGKPISQEIFAAWLEDHIPDLASPTKEEKDEFEAKLLVDFGEPNAIAQLSRGLTIHVSSVVSEVTVLQSGAGSIQFEEHHKDSDGKPLKIPGLFMIAIPLFVGGYNVRIPVRLRYRKASGGVVWTLHLFRPEYFVREALVVDLDRVAEKTELPVYEGAPEI